jgi:hypothetical protein
LSYAAGVDDVVVRVTDVAVEPTSLGRVRAFYR